MPKCSEAIYDAHVSHDLFLVQQIYVITIKIHWITKDTHQRYKSKLIVLTLIVETFVIKQL